MKSASCSTRDFHGPAHPAVSYVCTSFEHAKVQVALDAVAAVPGDGPTTVIRKRCPSLPGGDAQSDVAILPRGDVVYVSGLAGSGLPTPAIKKDCQSLATILTHLGVDRRQVVQVKAFIASMRDADVVRQQVADVFGRTAPRRWSWYSGCRTCRPRSS